MKTIIANMMDEEVRVAMLEEGVLRDIAIGRHDDSHIVNHIYKGVIKNILPAMQAAFVDIGREKNAFLYLGDVFPRTATKEEIQQTHLSVGQSLLVQVVKDEMGMKGPKVTANVSLAGRYCVLMPTVDYIGVSKKINDEQERERLRLIVDKTKPKGMGAIIRTVAKGVSEEELQRDLQHLMRTWDSITARYHVSKGTSLLYREADVLIRMVRDHLTLDVKKVIIDRKEDYERVMQLFSEKETLWRERIEWYRGELPVFTRYGVEEQLTELMKRQIELPSGATLVIDYTEALTVIDVNTGKYIGNSTLRDTILKVNIEAAREIARQLRLRDIGGIILVDFIDMERPSDKEQVLHILAEELKQDRVRTHVLGMTALGLVEITRKKARQSLYHFLYDQCPVCLGSGVLYSAETVAIQIIRHLRYLVFQKRAKGDLLIHAHPDVLALLKEKRKKKELEEELGRSLVMEESGHPNREVFSILSAEI